MLQTVTMEYRPVRPARREVSVIGRTWNIDLAIGISEGSITQGLDLGMNHIDTAEM